MSLSPASQKAEAADQAAEARFLASSKARNDKNANEATRRAKEKEVRRHGVVFMRFTPRLEYRRVLDECYEACSIRGAKQAKRRVRL